ncbi:hypothetical protein VOLCADRAFT_103722 [Volvox carteri f. nagariensis]|uniref:Flagellar associated protein n=1 Tax=Volvox carteri f. nagariensis TaxID=3068 RepID=D8TN58_VOLCA|nr:uncharacterized protein VOLCADRAFT_103722 [Volvox carteri f. nagariensis]EFJ50932.1 hypothetical protein VOLCADRAFT_103722 [Volvox carteri f. nagariensis]|eukprot:XP_002947944.1 hypothetical protein VOLCADRAFT_103722 [Volvox carteri f. nagariensis]
MQAWEEPSPPAFYDTDAGHKMSLAKGVSVSPHRYSVMRSNAPRLAEAPREVVPFGAYDIDTGRKQSVENSCRDSRRFYAAVFESHVPRFTRPWSSPVTDVFYDPERLKDHAPVDLAKSLGTTAINYSIHRSRYKRFPDRPLMTESPDVVYDVDCHLAKNKCSLYTSVVHSPVVYSNMSSTPNARPWVKPDDYKVQLGPGSYDYKIARSVSVSPSLDSRPLSSMASTVKRFGSGEAHRMIGQSWGPDRANKHWSRGTTISKTEYLRPQYLPKAYEAPKTQAKPVRTET